jgi:catechol 2,3-dioxygenase-like lactoylglutathione lyase family enzyme
MNFRLEHANLSVRDIEAMIHFLTTAFPEFRGRGEGKARDGSCWVHLGTDDTDIALNQTTTGSTGRWVPYSGEPAVNHLAYEVDDVEAVRIRLKTAGFDRTAA